VDECHIKLDKCEATCTNTPGSYKCSCPYGQVLASDGYSCIECAIDRSGIKYSKIQSPTLIEANKNVWHVAICGTNSTTCSGSLINDKFVITSASCVCNDQQSLLQSVTVKFNKENGCEIHEIDSIDYRVTQIICHPMYNDNTFAYNVALLKLNKIVDISTFQPVCLPTNRDKTTTSIENFAGIYGYEFFEAVGSGDGNSDTEVAEELYIQITQIVSNDECSTSYGHILLVDNGMMCTSK